MKELFTADYAQGVLDTIIACAETVNEAFRNDDIEIVANIESVIGDRATFCIEYNTQKITEPNYIDGLVESYDIEAISENWNGEFRLTQIPKALQEISEELEKIQNEYKEAP